jgi:hypothetical protein
MAPTDLLEAPGFSGKIDWDWVEEAQCRGQELEQFFQPEEYPRLRTEFCTWCPVKQKCMFNAIATESVGFFAGTDEIERYYLVQKLEKAKKGRTARRAKKQYESSRRALASVFD